MTKAAERSLPRRRTWVQRVLAAIGRTLMKDFGVAGMWTGGMMVDASMMWAFSEWTRRNWAQAPVTVTDDWVLSAPPAPSPERLIPEVPLTPDELVLWSDLLAADS